MRLRSVTCRGFTLIELMITLAIISILLAIALPQFNDYLLRGKLAEGVSLVSDLQLRQEQYYQDNRIYASGMTPQSAGQIFTDSSCCTTGCNSATTSNPGYNASPSSQAYTCYATAPSLSYTYRVSESGAKQTIKPDGTIVNCWLKSAGGSC